MYTQLKERLTITIPYNLAVKDISNQEYNSDEISKDKVDLYLKLIEEYGYKPHLMEIDKIIEFVEKERRITFKVDIAIYNTNLQPKIYIVINNAKYKTKGFNLIMRKFFKAAGLEGNNSIESIIYKNPGKKLTVINFKKYRNYTSWKDSKYSSKNLTKN